MAKTKIQLLGINYDAKSSFMRGSAQAAEKIRENLHNTSSSYLSESGIDLEYAVEWLDDGNIEVGDYPDLLPAIRKKLNPEAKQLFLGGDHSISFPLVEAMQELYGKFTILHFDAHTDLYDVFEGDRFSHACPFARIMENKLCERLIQVGVRTVSKYQSEQVEKYGVEVIRMFELDRLKELRIEGPVYISLDLDVFDPAYAPGVSHHEAGGMSPRELINFLLKIELNLIGADIVEYNPFRDQSEITAALAAKMLKEIAAKMIS